MSSITNTLVIIQQNTIRYGFPLLLAFGNIGNLLAMIIFSQRRHRRNPCSLYLLTSTIVGMIGLNWGFGTNLNALYQSPDPFTVSEVLCRTRGYILQTTSVIYRSMIILACIDRYAMSSSRANIRALSSRTIALKMIGGTILFWLIVSVPQPIFQTIQNNRCAIFGTYGLFFSIYQICIFGVISPLLMIIFGILLWKNLKNVRVRVRARHQVINLQHPQDENALSKRDIGLMKLALAEVITAILLTSLYPVNTLYMVLTSNLPNKSQERIQVEGFMGFLSLSLLFYLNYCMTFYLYVMMSRSFRREILQCFRRPNHVGTSTVPQEMPLRYMNTSNYR